MNEAFSYSEAEELFGTGYMPRVVTVGDAKFIMSDWGINGDRELSKSQDGVRLSISVTEVNHVDEWYEICRSYLDAPPEVVARADACGDFHLYTEILAPYFHSEYEWVPDFIGRELWEQAA